MIAPNTKLLNNPGIALWVRMFRKSHKYATEVIINGPIRSVLSFSSMDCINPVPYNIRMATPGITTEVKNTIKKIVPNSLPLRYGNK